jgi:hypothetical protein
MALKTYTETIGPVRIGSGGVAFFDYDLSKRKNITLTNISCLWTGTTPTTLHVNAGIDPYRPAIPEVPCTPWQNTQYNIQSQTYSSQTGLGGTRTSITVSCPGGAYTVTSVQWWKQYNGSTTGGGGGSCGETYYSDVTPGNLIVGVFYNFRYNYTTSGCSGGSPYVPAHAAHEINPRDYTFYSRPLSASIGSQLAISYSGTLGDGISSATQTVPAAMPGSVNRFNFAQAALGSASNTSGGNGSVLFQMTVTYTLNTPVAIKYISTTNKYATTTLLPLCKQNDPMLYSLKLRCRGPNIALTGAQYYNSAAYADQLANTTSATASDVLLPPAAQRTTDIIYFGYSEVFNGLNVVLGTSGVYTGTGVWEYWNGTAWTALAGVVDGTVGFTAVPGTYYVKWTYPVTWPANAVNSVTKFWIRFKLSECSAFTTQPKATQIHVSEILCADLAPATGTDRADWSGVMVCLPSSTGYEIMAWRKKAV